MFVVVQIMYYCKERKQCNNCGYNINVTYASLGVRMLKHSIKQQMNQKE